MNKFLRQEISKGIRASTSTWDAELYHDLVDREVEHLEVDTSQLEIDFYNLLFAVQAFNRRYVHNQDHITSML